MVPALYIVTFDGSTDGYGSDIYLLGVFDSEEAAEAAVAKLDESVRDTARINEGTLNESFDVEKIEEDASEYYDGPLCFQTSAYLGGYHE